MCRSLIFKAYLIGMCIFQHIFKMSTKLHNCCVMYKINFWLSKSAYCNNICITKLDICVLLPCISWPRVVSWPPSSYFEISINLKACIILEWSIIIRFIITTTFKTCATTHLSV